ncbi:PQ-loop repeat family protein [Actinidia rufa]|uniref:PQ-loop repeat family protein n=1 Tax=Actinidia rufa TaxID=165716 RepID=A0A7J0FHE4_9ERIC|nr:PQ-loop repeat family protein [Actinidia rufa]
MGHYPRVSTPLPRPYSSNHTAIEPSTGSGLARIPFVTTRVESARSLSSSHTPPTSGFFLAQRRTSTSACHRSSFEEPFLGGNASPQATPPSNTKTMLCAFSAVTFFLGSLNLHRMESNRLDMVLQSQDKGVVIRVGRKLLQVSSGLLQETAGSGSSGIGTLLGWGMAAIYMGGRLPQICLNVRISLSCN